MPFSSALLLLIVTNHNHHRNKQLYAIFWTRKHITATRFSCGSSPALSVHLTGINVRIDHNNLSVLLGKSFALVSGGCAAECCCRSVARCAASSYCRSFVRRAAEISRSGTLHSTCYTSAAIYPVFGRVTRSLSCEAFTLLASTFFSYLICIYLISIIARVIHF